MSTADLLLSRDVDPTVRKKMTSGKGFFPTLFLVSSLASACCHECSHLAISSQLAEARSSKGSSKPAARSDRMHFEMVALSVAFSAPTLASERTALIRDAGLTSSSVYPLRKSCCRIEESILSSNMTSPAPKLCACCVEVKSQRKQCQHSCMVPVLDTHTHTRQ